jgi:hypothetical protein
MSFLSRTPGCDRKTRLCQLHDASIVKFARMLFHGALKKIVEFTSLWRLAWLFQIVITRNYVAGLRVSFQRFATPQKAVGGFQAHEWYDTFGSNLRARTVLSELNARMNSKSQKSQ